MNSTINNSTSFVSIKGSAVLYTYQLYNAYKDAKPNTKSFSSLKNQVEQFEMQVTRDSIQENKSIRKAAEKLGVSHSTLVKKMKRWKMIIE
ncbi:helix-turn-helix domain-containing protein [Heyndrickxia coagulans]|uniref:helix-turn-helix domain-containing protein n=1 Tax=Heyndrickxia TaxID=2837504 RepID=UPI00399C4D84